jgi:low temperature requirement protein LtrA
MVQMTGVLILALGLPEVFSSIETGPQLDNGVAVAGYVVMRVSMVGLWLRVVRQDPTRRPCAKVYIATITSSQVCWCLLLFTDLSVNQTFALAMIPFFVEMSGPVIAERRYGGTPWHAHHIAERYGLLAIITLGEGVIGTVAAMSALVHAPGGWTLDAVLVLAAGIGLTFGMWWVYFTIPWGEVLHHHRGRAFVWGYCHMLIFGSITATGAGLHVAEYYLGGEYPVSEVGAVLSVAVPLGVFTLGLFVIYSLVMHAGDPFHLGLMAGTAAVLVLAVALAVGGASVAVCLLVVAVAPLITVVGYELVGHEHMREHLAQLSA